jgi:hypothetical protein
MPELTRLYGDQMLAAIQRLLRVATLVVAASTAFHANATFADDTHVVPVDVDTLRSQTFRRDGNSLRPLSSVLVLPTEPGQGLLVEAEEADEFIGQVRRDDATKTAYVAGCRIVRCHVQFPKEGSKAVVWARLRHGPDDTAIQVDWGSLPTGWGTFTWQSRTAYQQRKLDADKENQKNATTWRWEQITPADWRREGGIWRFEARWTGSWTRRGCPDVDKLLIIPGDGTPEAVKHVTERAPVREHVVYSAPLRYPNVARVLGASLAGEAEGAIVEATTDDGKTWADPVSLTTKPGATIQLRARFPKPAAATTAIRRFDLKVELESAVRFTAGTLRIDFDKTRCGVVRISDAGTNPRTLACPVEAIPLFTLELKKRGQPWPTPRKIIVPDEKSLTQVALKGDSHATLFFKLLDGAILANVQVEQLDGGQVRWQIEIDNKSDWDVLACNFPRFAGLKIGDSGVDDWFVNTSRYGPWIASLPPEDRPYPGWGALGWCDLHDATAGLSLAVCDPLEGQTTFRLQGDLSLRQTPETCILEAVKEHCVASGEKKTFAYTMLVHQGDWHAAADNYRAAFEKQFGRAEHWPDWVRDSNGWLAYNSALYDQQFKWPMLLDTFEDARRLGFSHVQVWGQFGSSSCGSFWWPSPKYGPVEQFAATTAEIRRRGGHIGFYFLYNEFNRYNLIDTKMYDGYLPRDAYPKDVPEFGLETFNRGMLVTDPAGKLTGWPADDDEMKTMTDTLASLHKEGKVTCWAPGSTWEVLVREPAWRDWLTRWACDLYTKQWHCDTPYIDVLGCKTQRSFDLRRSEDGHVFGSGEMELAKRLFEAGRKIDPDFLLVAEGKNELVTRWAAGMTSSSHPGWIDLDAHRYTHPDHLLYLGAQNGGYQQNLTNVLLAYLYGAKFDLLELGDIRRIRQVIALRQSFIRYVTRATYCDTVGLTFSGEGVEARRFDRVGPDVKAITVCVINPNEIRDGKLAVDLSPFGKDKVSALLMSTDGEARLVRLENQAKFEVTIPPSCASALLLVSQPAPGDEMLAQITPVIALAAKSPTTQPGVRVTGWVAKFSAATAGGPCAIEGLGGKGAVTAPSETGVVSVTQAWPSDRLADGGDVALTVGGTPLARAFLWPIVEDGSFEKYPIPQKVGEPFDGKRFVQFPPAKGWQGTYKRLNVRPGCTYRISVMGRRTGDKGTIHGLVRFHSAGKGWQYGGLNFPQGQFNEWVKLQCEITAPADLTEADVYLYNSDSQETVDYDSLRAQLIAEK